MCYGNMYGVGSAGLGIGPLAAFDGLALKVTGKEGRALEISTSKTEA